MEPVSAAQRWEGRYLPGRGAGRIGKSGILLLMVSVVFLAAWIAPGARAQTLVGSIYQGQAGVGDPLANVRVTFGDSGVLTWQIIGEWAYYDDEDELLFFFPSITGTGTYTYNAGTRTLTFDSEWSGDIVSTDPDLHCTYARMRSSASGVSVSADMSTITGTFLQTGKFYYEGYGSWTDTDIPGTLDLTRVSGPPTATPTSPPQPTETPTPRPTETPTPGDTPTPRPRPTAIHPEFDANGDGWIDAEDLMLLMRDWHSRVGTGD